MKRWPTNASGPEPAIDPQHGFAGNRTKPRGRELATRQARPLAFAYGTGRGALRTAVRKAFERARRQPVILVQKNRCSFGFGRSSGPERAPSGGGYLDQFASFLGAIAFGSQIALQGGRQPVSRRVREVRWFASAAFLAADFFAADVQSLNQSAVAKVRQIAPFRRISGGFD